MTENKVLAVVNGQNITQYDVDMMLQSLGPQQAMQFQSEEGKQRILDELINQKLILADAKEKNMESEAGFIDELNTVKDNILTQYAIRKVLNSISVNDNEIKEFYDNNMQYYQKGESVKASHILVDDEQTATDILGKIENGMTFEEAAKEYSKCPSKEKGGDLGNFERGRMVKEFEDAAFDLSEGEMSGPVKTDFGYHIIKTVSKNEASTMSFEEARGQIANQLMGSKQNSAYVELTTNLAKKYDIERK